MALEGGRPPEDSAMVIGGSCRMGKKASEKAGDNLSDFKVGDRVKVNMHRGRIVEAVVKAVVEKTHGRPIAGFVWKRDCVDLFMAGS
jgi:hypothetical protein